MRGRQKRRSDAGEQAKTVTYALYLLSYRQPKLPGWIRTNDLVLRREVTVFYATGITAPPENRR